jgi:SAM-dependent methyltransferase
MTDQFLSSHATRNRDLWDQRADEYQAHHGPQLAAAGGAAWGVWQLPESELQVLGDGRGRDVLEFGCGAAQWSIAIHAQGAKTTALDLSERQLEHARELMLEAAVEFPLVCASAERTPFADASFDIVFCDYGAGTANGSVCSARATSSSNPWSSCARRHRRQAATATKSTTAGRVGGLWSTSGVREDSGSSATGERLFGIAAISKMSDWSERAGGSEQAPPPAVAH